MNWTSLQPIWFRIGRRDKWLNLREISTSANRIGPFRHPEITSQVQTNATALITERISHLNTRLHANPLVVFVMEPFTNEMEESVDARPSPPLNSTHFNSIPFRAETWQHLINTFSLILRRNWPLELAECNHIHFGYGRCQLIQRPLLFDSFLWNIR